MNIGIHNSTIEDGSIYFLIYFAIKKKLDFYHEQIKTCDKMYLWNDNKKLIAEFDFIGSNFINRNAQKMYTRHLI